MLFSICFVFNHFFTIEELKQVIGSHLLRLPKEPAMKIVREGTRNFPTRSAMAGVIEI